MRTKDHDMLVRGSAFVRQWGVLIALMMIILIDCSRPPPTPERAETVVSLTPQERNWLDAHPVVTVALDQENPPLSFLRADAEEGSYSGASIDYMNLIARRTGMRLRFVGANWPVALQQAMDHKVDGLMGASVREDRKARLNFTEPYLEIASAITTRSDEPEVRNLADFAGRRIAVVKNTIQESVVQKRCPGSIMVEVLSAQEGIDRVLTNQADGFFGDQPVVQQAIKVSTAKVKISLLYYNSEAGALRVALRNDAPELLSIFNKGIAAIRQEEHDQIRARWLGTGNNVRIQRELPMSPAQTAWLENHRVIRVAVDPAQRPLSWQAEGGNFQGITVDYLERFEQMLGVRFQMVSAGQFKSADEALRSGRVDVFAARTPSPDHSDVARFSAPYVTTPLVIFGLASHSSVGGLEGLSGKRVAVLHDSFAEETLKNKAPGAQVLIVRGVAEAVALVRKGEADAYLGALLTTTQYLVESGDTDIRVIGETGMDYRLAMAVRQDWPELVEILDRALSAMPASEREAIRYRWGSVRVEPKIDYRLIYGLLFMVLLAAGFIVQLRVMVRRRTADLRKEIAVRQEKERELRESEAFRRRVFDASRIPIVVMDAETYRYMDCNPATAVIYRYQSRDEVLGKGPMDFSAPEQYDGTPSADKARSYIARAMAEGTVVFEWRHQRPDGELWDAEVHLMSFQSGDKQLLQFTLQDITERKRDQESLRRQSRLQDMLMRLAAKYVNLPLEDVDAAIRAGLEEIGTFVGAARANVFKYDFQLQTGSATHSWSIAGRELHISDYQVIPLATLKDWKVELHRRGESIWLPDTLALPPGALRDIFKTVGTLTFLAVPLMNAGECLGFVNFAWTKQHHVISNDEQHLLTVFAHLLVNIQLRKDAEARQRALTEQLRINERRLSLAINATSDAVWEWNLQTNATYYSPRWYEMLGYNDQQFAMNFAAWQQLCHPDDVQPTIEQVQATLSGAQSTGYVAEFRMRRADGAWMWILGRGNVVERDAEGKPLMLSGTNSDITERKRTQELLLESEKLRTVAGLAAGMAHEINNPLAGMVQNAQVIVNRLTQDMPANQQAAERHGTTFQAVRGFIEDRQITTMLESIRESGRQATQIVRNLLSYSRRDQGSSTVDLAELVTRTLELAASDVELKKDDGLGRVAVVREFAPDTPIALCHASQLQQVLLNLIRNAVQAMRANPAERPPRLVLRTRNVQGDSCIEVQDNGPGIAPEHRGKLFEPFFSTKPQGEGTGLGLFVCYHIVTIVHGGRITMDAPADGGACFRIVMPRNGRMKTGERR